MKKKHESANPNRFSLGSQVGGPDAALATGYQEQRLRDAMNSWTGNYSSAIKEFAFLLRVDGEFHTYTQEWNIDGAQEAKWKKNWIEVEIGIPRSAWKAEQAKTYRHYLASEVEKGLHSMIDLLKRSRHEIDGATLLSDWAKIKREYLADDPARSTTVQ
jgi:hypothetical protein